MAKGTCCRVHYRIGLWRVLNQAAISSEEKNQWLDSISKVYEDYTSLDRIHAAETLAKLKVSPNSISAKVTDSVLKSDHNPMWAYTYWGTAYTSEKEMYEVKNKLINIILNAEESTLVKKIAIYALYKMKNLGVQNWDLLSSRAVNEPMDSPLYTSLLTCTLANTPKDSLLGSIVTSTGIFCIYLYLSKHIITNTGDNWMFGRWCNYRSFCDSTKA